MAMTHAKQFFDIVQNSAVTVRDHRHLPRAVHAWHHVTARGSSAVTGISVPAAAVTAHGVALHADDTRYKMHPYRCAAGGRRG